MGKTPAILLLIVVFFSCQKDPTCDRVPPVGRVDLTLDYQDLTGALHAIEDTSALAHFFEAHPIIRDYFFGASSYPSRSVMLEEVLALLKNPHVDTLYQETQTLIDQGLLRSTLEEAFKRIRYFYPDYRPPKVQTVYSAFGSDVFFSDSLLIIGLDYYLGAEASYRPNVYDYLKVRLTPDHLVPHIIQFTSLKFNATIPGQRTVLDEMIYYGKALHFTKTILPCTPDSLIMGYSSQALASAEVSEAYLWSYFIENGLLYDKKPLNIAKYIEERPGIPEIDKICPGRIGQWLGWRIVDQYMTRETADFQELMANVEARDIFMRSRYRPRNR